MAVPAARGVEHPWQVVDLLDTADGATLTMHEQLLKVLPVGRPPVRIPVGDVAVVLVRDTTTVSGQVLTALSARGTALLVCDWRGVPVGGTWPWREHSRIGARTRAQVQCPRPRAKQAWAAIVRSKILGQAWVLRSQRGEDSGWRRVGEYAAAVRSGDLDNREGVAAAAYWRSFADGFVRDRHLADPVNSALNYGYTVLRGHAVRAVAQAGLCPAIGVFHRGPDNQFALADDLMEPFRPAVDATVLALSASGELDMSLQECRRRLVRACSTPMQESAGVSVTNAMVSAAQGLGMFFEQQRAVFQVPSWRGILD